MPKTYPPGLGHTPKQSETPKARAASIKRSATSPKRTPKSASAGKKSLQEVAAPPSGGLLPCMVYVVLYHASAAGALVYWHAHEHRVLNGWHVLLAVFCVINAWICICEIALLVCNAEIKRQHAEYASTLGPHVMPSVFLFDRVTVFELFTLRFWSLMWSQYGVLDPSYTDTTTFGFCVDIGNGVTTLVPTVLFAVGMTFDILPARVLGMLGLVKFWQEFYGTCIYFFQYFFNRRYDHSPLKLVLGVVVPANVIWMACPAVGMWVCQRLILDGTFEVVRGSGLDVTAWL